MWVKEDPARTREGVPGQGLKRDQRIGARAMYSGMLINELIATVERAEARLKNVEENNELERWYASVHTPVVVEADLAGVA
jgi:hypothetical protein